MPTTSILSSPNDEQQQQQGGSFEFYLFDKRSQSFIKLKPDYTNRIPLSHAHKREHKGAKADKTLGVLIPLTKRRPNSSDYVQLATIARKYPRIDTIAVINPTLDSRGVGLDGPGPDPEYQNAIRYLQANGIRVIGYLATAEGEKPIDEAKLEVDKWIAWYPDIQGIFFDQMSTSLEKLDYYKKLDQHVKTKLDLTIADIAYGKEVGESIANDAYLHNTGIDIFVVYENRGFPTEDWYAAYKKEWTSSYPRSRFAWLVFGVPDNDALACTSFIDKVVGIEGLAGYVMVQPELGTPDDKRGFSQWDTLSPYLETVLIALDRQANQERLPFKKGPVPEQQKVTGDQEIRVTTTATEQTPSAEETGSVERGDKDSLGISKIYASKPGGFEWQSEYNAVLTSLGTITIKATPKLLNQEITGYFRFKAAPLPEQVLAIHTRTGALDSDLCDISGYIGILSSDCSVYLKKQINGEAETGKRAITMATNEPLSNRWIGLKFIVYNYQVFDQRERKESTAVSFQMYVDDNVTDMNKELVVKNQWRKIMSGISDEGGWFANNIKTPKKTTKAKDSLIIDKCPSLDTSKPENTIGREMDEIITMAGGSQDSNCVIFEFTENCIPDFRYLSVREIHPSDSD